ncbi:MAG: hypothetical protein LBT99_04680 [Bifidobacteriaceae bacterium]|jgi:NitT/TauT family transport system substrate-binding protein|nr:hypothetical protein [Bifidobacteriaceae bacterium]
MVKTVFNWLACKKVTTMVLLLVFLSLLIIFVSSCGHEEKVTTSKMRVHALNGPTAIGLLGLDNNPRYNLTVDANVDTLLAGFSRGDFDIATVPSNMAAALYNKNKSLRIIDINTLSPLYIVGQKNLLGSTDKNTWQNFSKEKFCATGKGAIPDIVINYLAKPYEVPKMLAKIDWQSSPATCIQKMVKDKTIVALLPEPYAQDAVRLIVDDAKLINLGDNFTQYSGFSIVTGVTIAKSDFIEQYSNSINQFLDDHKASIDNFKNNPQSFITTMNKYSIYGEYVIEVASRDINIAFYRDQDMKDRLLSFYTFLQKNSPKLIGGTLPDNSIYYNN